MRSSLDGSSCASMYDWSLCGSTRAGEQPPAPVLEDAGVVAGGERVGAGVACKGEQAVEAERPVAAHARVGRLAAGVALHERVDHRAAKVLAQVERDVRDTERVTRLPRGDHRLRRAARALGVRARRDRARDAASRRSRSAASARERRRCRRRRSSRRRRGPESAARGTRGRSRSQARQRQASPRRPRPPRAASDRQAAGRARPHPPRRCDRPSTRESNESELGATSGISKKLVSRVQASDIRRECWLRQRSLSRPSPRHKNSLARAPVFVTSASDIRRECWLRQRSPPDALVGTKTSWRASAPVFVTPRSCRGSRPL